MTDWSFGELPELMEVDVGGGQMVLGYPGLADDGESVSLCVFDTLEEAVRRMPRDFVPVHAAVP